MVDGQELPDRRGVQGQVSFGRLPLPRDDRDWNVWSLLDQAYDQAGNLPARRFWGMGGYDMRLDQGNTGTCQGNAWTNALIAAPSEHTTYAGFRDPNTAEMWAQQLYVDATGDETLMQGAYTRQILDELLGRGMIASYHRCQTADETVDVLRGHGPVCYGLAWYRSMDDTIEEYGNTYIHVDESSGIRGYHEVCFTGVDLAPTEGPPYARMENSWGPDWGHHGTARVPIEDLHILYLGDAFTIVEAPF